MTLYETRHEFAELRDVREAVNLTDLKRIIQLTPQERAWQCIDDSWAAHVVCSITGNVFAVNGKKTRDVALMEAYRALAHSLVKRRHETRTYVDL